MIANGVYCKNQEQITKELTILDSLIQNKQQGSRAFVAKRNYGIGADRSVVLVSKFKKRKHGLEEYWIQGIKCWGDNHKQRATEYVHKYNCATEVKTVRK